MSTSCRVLRVLTGHTSAPDSRSGLTGVLDYRVYDRVPRGWRRLEEMLRLDVYLALCARRAAADYDVIWAGSEKVGVPLALLGGRLPIVTVVHHLESRAKRAVLKLLSVPRRWAAIGTNCSASRDFVCSYYGVRPERTFQALAAPLQVFTPEDSTGNGAILSLGVANRDYGTLLQALADLPGHEAVVHVFSRYGDRYRGGLLEGVPRWVRLAQPVATRDLPACYRDARFVVLPLRPSTHWGAGLTVALEAASNARAIIATDTPGMRSVIVDGETGLLVPGHDPAALRDAIRALWSQPATAARMGRAARRHVEQHFHPDAIQAGIDAMLERLVLEARR